MTGSPAVSVVLPVYNVEGYLRGCLDSVRTQTLEDIEIICVDDGSTDGSGAILDEYAATDGRFRVIHQPNSGAGAARNRGLAEARGKYLFFCDADDRCEGCLFERTVETAERANADVVVFEYDRTYLDGRPAKHVRVGRDCGSEPYAASELSSNLFQVIKMVPWNKLFRSEHIRRSGLLFQNLPRGNDIYFVCCAAALADRIVFLHERLYHHVSQRTDGLHAGYLRHPFTFYEAKDAVRDELRRRGLHARFARSLALSVFNEAFGLLDRYGDDRIFAEAYNRLHARLLDDPDSDFRRGRDLPPGKWRKYRLIVKHSDPMDYRAALERLESSVFWNFLKAMRKRLFR